MKMLRFALAPVLALSIAFGPLSSAALAKGKGDFVALNPTSLRQALLKGSLSVTQGLNAVHDAKDKLNVARASIFPGVNLGALLKITDGPSFALSTVDFLLPFLTPSAWFNLSQESNLFEAEKIAFRVMELNLYGSALSLYFTILADLEIKRVYEQQAQDLNEVYQVLLHESELLDTIPQENLWHAEAQAKFALVRASQLAELSNVEIANLRKALGLSIDTAIALEPATMPASDAENASLKAAVETAQRVAPEDQQIDFLVEAARSGRWSKSFGFINTGAISASAPLATGGGLNNVSFDNLMGRQSVTLGLALYPTIELSNRNVDEIKLRKIELIQEKTRILESALLNVAEASRQLDLASDAETKMQAVYESKRTQYELGLGSFTNMLLARIQASDAAIARIKATLDLNLLRTTLHRTMLTDQFAEIKGCDVSRKEESSGFWDWIGGLFGSDESHSTLDQICREAN